MPRLGKRQIDLLAGLGHVGSALILPTPITDSLVKRGLMRPTGDKPGTENGFLVLTPAGYRAIADAIEAGLIPWPPDWPQLLRSRAAARANGSSTR